MFLNQLSCESKNAFLELCIYAAHSDKVFKDEESQMIFDYCHEMNIPEVMPENTEELDDILNFIKEKASEKEKNIIYLEILGLLKADNEFDEKEKAFLQRVIIDLGIRESIVNKIDGLLNEYMAVCSEIYLTINEPNGD